MKVSIQKQCQYLDLTMLPYVYLIVLYFLSVPLISKAQDSQTDESLSVFSQSSPRPDGAIAPVYPKAYQNVGREGWVLLSFIVTKDGEIKDPVIKNSGGGKLFERAVLKALDSWAFEPAMQNGEPVDQSLTQKVVFTAGESRGASKDFKKKYEEIFELIQNQDLERADKLMTLLSIGGRSLYEDSWLAWLDYNYHKASGDKSSHGLIRNLKAATIDPDEGDYVNLEPDIYVSAMQTLYSLQIQVADYKGALITFEKFQEVGEDVRESKYYEQVLVILEPSYKQILALISDNNIFPVNAEIEESAYWIHNLLRQTFSLEEINGGLEEIDVRCQNRIETFNISDARITIPASWIDCSLYIRGEEGTTFVLYEHPDEKGPLEKGQLQHSN